MKQPNGRREYHSRNASDGNTMTDQWQFRDEWTWFDMIIRLLFSHFPLQDKTKYVIMKKVLSFLSFLGRLFQTGKEKEALVGWLEIRRSKWTGKNVSNKANVVFMQYELWIYGQAIIQSIIGHCILDGSSWTLGFNMFGWNSTLILLPLSDNGKNSSWEEHLLWAVCGQH